MKNFLFIFLFILLYSTAGFGQCNGFHRTMCELPFEWDYEYNSQSVDIEMTKGQSFRMKIILYEGYDYYIGFCKEEGLGKLNYQFLSNDVVIDQTNKKVENNIEYVELTSKKTRIVLIDIQTEQADGNSVNENRKCLGIIIGNRKSKNTF